MILVTGATGTNGREILKALAARNVPAKAMMRSAADAGDLPAGITAVEGDFDDEASLARALSGVERAFLLTPSTEHAEAQQLRFVAAAARAGVRHLVKLSQFAARADSPVRFLRYHAAVEDAIRASGLEWTFLRPNLFMQGLLQFADMVREKRMIAAPIGDARVSVVDVRDNAAAAAAALTEDGHAGRTYTLTGPEALTHADMAAALSAATGSPIAFVDASEDDLRHAMGGHEDARVADRGADRRLRPLPARRGGGDRDWRARCDRHRSARVRRLRARLRPGLRAEVRPGRMASPRLRPRSEDRHERQPKTRCLRRSEAIVAPSHHARPA